MCLDRRQLINDKDAARLIEALADQRPEAIKVLRWDVRQPGTEEHHVIALLGAPGEEVGLHEANVSGGNSPRRDREHLRRAIDRGQFTGIVRQQGRPLAGATGELEYAPSRCEGSQRLLQLPPRLVVCDNGTGRVVFVSAITVVGHLLGEQVLEFIARHHTQHRHAVRLLIASYPGGGMTRIR
jgi:hypothetical protein